MSRAERQAARWARQARSRANPPADALQNVGQPTPPPPKPASPRNIVLEIKDERRTADTSQAEAALVAHLRGAACDLWQLLADADRADALRDLVTDTRRSYAETRARAARVGGWLRLHLKAGDRVALVAPNSLLAFEAHYACAFGGLTLLNCNPRLASAELKWCLEHARCKVLIADGVYRDLVAAARTDQITLDASTYEDVASKGPVPERPNDALTVDSAEMYYTSGTSGRPKGVVLTRRNVLLHALQCIVEHRLQSKDVWLHVAPMFHLVDAYAIFSITFVRGRHLILPSFDARTTLDALCGEGVTVTNMASTMVSLLLKDPRCARPLTSSLELLSCGGAPLSRETVLRAQRIFGCEFFLSYGMTECCGKISTSIVDEGDPIELVTTSGRAFGLIELRVVRNWDSTEQPVDVSQEEVGEVWIRGPTVFQGYDNNDEATAKAFHKEWFRTGDLATINSYGYITIVDRAKDMILVGSENVYCCEVERVLHDHPRVKTACVYGLPCETLGERVVAKVVGSCSVHELRRHCSKFLADYKVPSHIDLVESLPLTGSGKVAKALLRKRDLSKPIEHVYNVAWVASAAQSLNMPQHIVVIGDASMGDTRLEAMSGSLTEERARIGKALRPESALVVVVDGDAEYAIKQVLATLQASSGHSVLIVTRGLYINDDDVVKPAAGAVWGLCRAARAEGIDVRVVDVDDEDNIPKELSQNTPEAAWRHNERFVPSLQKVEVEAGDDVGGGVHVIVGGAGGLGAAWAARLAGTVIVAGRREKKPATLTCDCHYVKCDITDEQDVLSLIKRAKAYQKPISVWHLAGVLDDRSINEMDEAHLERVLAPKVQGSRNLDAATRQYEVDRFVVFTSVYGLLGHERLGAYAAANAFQDALCAQRRSEGLPALSIAWGTWAGAGMAHRLGSDFARAQEASGLGMLSLDEGFTALAALSTSSLSSAAVLPMNWARYAACRSEPHPLAATMCTPTETSSSLRATLESLSEEDRIRQLDAFLATLVPRFELDAAVTSLGVTSLGATALAASLSEALSLKLPPTLAYECVSLRGIRDHVLSLLFPVVEIQRALPLKQSTKTEALRITAMSLRTAAGDAQELWTALIAGRDCVTGVPSNRPHTGRPGAYLDASTISMFDAKAFGMSRAEAAATDPQQRLFLACCAESLETAGYRATPATTSENGLQIGVFCAIETSDYAVLQQSKPNPYTGTGSHTAVAPNRVSYTFDLRGPSVALNTACSSSLTCLSVAKRSLDGNECSAVLVGGANLQLRPQWSDCFAAAGMLSPSYKCKFGDNDADGYVRGEGVGAFLLERGTHGVVGIGIGQDGRSNGLTAPNPKAQQAVLRAAYSTYDGNVALIEAHGTGTKLGDPIELGALGKHFPGMVRTGSVKTNIGHLEGCSGLAGLAKAVSTLKTGVVPRSLHLKTPNTAVDWSSVTIVAQNEDLGVGAVGVSSFGFGGALGHVVVTGRQVMRREEVVNNEALIVPLEAHSSASLRATCRRIKVWSQNENVDDVAQCLVKRSSLNKRRYRTAAVVPAKGGRAALAEALDAVAINEHEGGVALAFVFTGQGAAYAGAVTSLLGDAAFRAAYEEAMQACGRHMDVSNLIRLGKDATADKLLDDASIAQPYGFCIAYALSKALLAKTNKALDAVVGHSLGEIAACCVAGVLSLHDAARLVVLRGRAVATRAIDGATVAVNASAEDVEALVDIEVAADNSMKGCAIAGEVEAVDVAIEALTEQGFKTKKLRAATGYHSRCVDGCVEDIPTVVFQSSDCAVYSTVTGARLSEEGDDYWKRQLRSKVRFREALNALRASSSKRLIIVEVGCAPHLSPHIDGEVVCTLRGPKKIGREPTLLAEAVSKLFTKGIELAEAKSSLKAPPTVFVGERCWFEECREATTPQKNLTGRTFSPKWVPASLLRATALQVLVLRDEESPLSVAIRENVRERRGRCVELPLLAAAATAQSWDCVVFLVPSSTVQEAAGPEEERPSTEETPLIPSTKDATVMVDDACRRASRVASLASSTAGALQAVLKCALNQRGPRRLVACTCNESEASSIAAGCVEGLMRAARREAGLAGSALVLRTLAVNDASHGDVAEELLSDRMDDALLAKNEVCVRRLQPVDESMPVSVKGLTFAISGGTGALGQRTAKHLLERGAARILLLARTTTTVEGCEVYKVDVASPESVTRFAVEHGSSIDGLIHAAGLCGDGSLQSRDLESLRKALKPKLDGALLLSAAVDAARQACHKPPVQMDVAFSSVSALLGNAGQTDYACSNGGLDARARYLSSVKGRRPRTSLSINWGPWRCGMASLAKNHGQGTPNAPYEALAEEDALAALDSALSKSGNICLARFDPKAVALAASREPILGRFLGVSSTKEQASTVVVDPLKAVACIVAKHTTVSSLTAATPLQTLGLDSLDAMACVRELNAATGASLSVIDVLGAKTLGEVASLVPTAPSSSDCSTDVLDVLQRHCSSEVEPQTKLASLGLDSLDAMAVVKDLSDATGKAWSVSDVLGAETLGDITLKAASRTAIPVGRSKEPRKEDKIPVKDLKEPCLLRRLWFTLLARIIGAQIAVCGAMPAFVLENYLPTRWRLAPKMWVLEARVGARVALWVEAQLPRPSRPYPGLPRNAFLRDQRLEFGTMGLHAWTPSYLFIARFTIELCITGVVYYVLWCLGCHLACAVGKWIVVGRQRAGRFPIWESSIGYRNALWQSAVPLSFSAFWWHSPWLPPFVQIWFLRAMGVQIGSRCCLRGPIAWDAPPGDLLTIGDGVVMSPNATVDTTSLTSTTVITLGHVRIENNVKIGDGAEIRHGAHVSEDAKVCAGAGCSTYVRRSATFPENRVAVDTVVRCTDGRDAYPFPLLTFLLFMPLVHFICALPAVSLLLRAPLILRRRPVVFGLSVLGAALLRGILEPCALGLILKMMRLKLERGKTYTLSRFFVSAHETRVFWRKLFIASCEAPFSFTPLCNLAWRWAGATVGRKGVVLSELHGAVDAPELVSIGDDCYLGAHVTLRPLKVDGSSVKAVGVSIGDGCFVGPNTLLQPGSMIKGATGANSIVSSHEIVPEGRVAIGDSQKPCTLAWRPHRLDASTEWGWSITSSLAMFATERLGHVVAVQAPRILLWVALGFVGRYPWSPPLHEVRVASLIHEAHTTPLLRVWLTLSTVASRNAALVLLLVACLIVADPLKPLTHIAFKWLVVGRAKETSKVPLRSGQHLRWACVQKLARCPAVDGAWRHVYEYASIYASCVGFKLGSRVRFYPYPSLLLAGAAEADLVEIGDDTVTSAATYAHDFSMLHLAMKPTSVGGGCDLGLSRHGQVLPGSHLPDGTVIQAPGRATHLAGLCGEAHQAWAGNPLVRCALSDAEYADAC